MVQSLEAVVEQAIAKNLFVRRRWSWVAETEEYFLKIPRESQLLAEDSKSSSTRANATYEHEALNLLSRACSAVVKPIGVAERYACIVLPKIGGQDLRDVLMRGRSPIALTNVLSQAIDILVAIHAFAPEGDGRLVPYKDYRSNPYLREMQQSMSARRTLVTFGFEVRNLRVDEHGVLRFFDPHELCFGYPEEDLTRFVLSLLMLTWGQLRYPKPWVGFSLTDLLDSYRSKSRALIDPARFQYCAGMNTEMRKAHSLNAIAEMQWLKKPVAMLYRSYFFRQVNEWWLQNDVQI